MKQGRMWLPLALAALIAVSTAPAFRADAATHKPAATTTAKPRVALHQFSGIVTALDKTSLTVAKAGKNARSMVFVRDAEMRTTGDLDKDARVTVWYREENGRPVARKVVVKAAPLSAQR